MRVALTGGTGFLGAHIAQGLLGAGQDPVCLVRPTSERAHLDALGVTQVPGSMEDAASLGHLVRDADAVIHCAGAIAARQARDYARTNVTGTQRLVDAVRGRGHGGPSFLYVSSLAAKGPSPSGVPRRADAPGRPVSAYGASKLEAETTVRALAPEHDVTIVRPPALYGPRDRGLLPLMRLARRGLWPVLGGRDALTSTLYGPDCAALVVALVAERGQETRRLLEPADGPPRTNAALRSAVQEAMGNARLRELRLPGPVVTAAAHVARIASRFSRAPSIFNPDKARELRAAHWLSDTATLAGIDWRPETDLTEGLRATTRWYEEEGWL